MKSFTIALILAVTLAGYAYAAPPPGRSNFSVANFFEHNFKLIKSIGKLKKLIAIDFNRRFKFFDFIGFTAGILSQKALISSVRLIKSINLSSLRILPDEKLNFHEIFINQILSSWIDVQLGFSDKIT